MSHGISQYFTFQGILTNCIFVILNSAAKDIDASSVAWVYIANSAPVLLVKLWLPYHIDKISYNTRYLVCSLLFLVSVVIVAISIASGGKNKSILALIGVSFSSAAGGFGEPSTLALASILDQDKYIPAFSLGTGIAGVFGYIWTIVLKDMLKLPMPLVIGFSAILPILLYSNFKIFLEPALKEKKKRTNLPETKKLVKKTDNNENTTLQSKLSTAWYLKKYMVSLFLVYVSEYAMQSGVWTTLGNPVRIRANRDEAYLYSNLLYQVGTLVSRSSGVCFLLDFRVTSLLPWIQLLLLIAFVLNGSYWFVTNEMIQLFFCFVAGLFGGLVYVNTFVMVARDENIPRSQQEFSVTLANIADTIGIILGDLLGLVIQGCLYGINKIEDYDQPPYFTCGFVF